VVEQGWQQVLADTAFMGGPQQERIASMLIAASG
jgi:hypothetical protein